MGCHVRHISLIFLFDQRRNDTDPQTVILSFHPEIASTLTYQLLVAFDPSCTARAGNIRQHGSSFMIRETIILAPVPGPSVFDYFFTARKSTSRVPGVCIAMIDVSRRSLLQRSAHHFYSDLLDSKPSPIQGMEILPNARFARDNEKLPINVGSRLNST